MTINILIGFYQLIALTTSVIDEPKNDRLCVVRRVDLPLRADLISCLAISSTGTSLYLGSYSGDFMEIAIADGTVLFKEQIKRKTQSVPVVDMIKRGNEICFITPFDLYEYKEDSKKIQKMMITNKQNLHFNLISVIDGHIYLGCGAPQLVTGDGVEKERSDYLLKLLEIPKEVTAKVSSVNGLKCPIVKVLIDERTKTVIMNSNEYDSDKSTIIVGSTDFNKLSDIYDGHFLNDALLLNDREILALSFIGDSTVFHIINYRKRIQNKIFTISHVHFDHAIYSSSLKACLLIADDGVIYSLDPVSSTVKSEIDLKIPRKTRTKIAINDNMLLIAYESKVIVLNLK